MIDTDMSIDHLSEVSIKNAKELIDKASKLRKLGEKSNRRRIARLFKDSGAIEATITLTDEVMRINSPRAATRLLRRAAAKASVRGFGFINSLGIRFIAVLSPLLPGLIVKIVHWRVRSYSKDLILDSRN